MDSDQVRRNLELRRERRSWRIHWWLQLIALVLAVASTLTSARFAFPTMSASEWAAWVQGVGTVAAVVAAILIDQGANRRQRERYEAERLQRASRWREAFDWAYRGIREISDLYEPVKPGEEAPPLRLETIRQQLSTIRAGLAMYATAEPPTAELGFAVASASAIFDRLIPLADRAMNPGEGKLAARLSLREAVSVAGGDLMRLNDRYVNPPRFLILPEDDDH